ncbi:splicing factor-like protein 1 [Rhodamnia argentea]|uniref:Branchpoint-bridging protein n=1 Tax=Rhodamnia argentea TaxID=178133 RepID=A0A8B8PPC3_9MYRT|nr:splicing factor-like protein 1 [Rhodamnia argentea]XP_048138236.1 splicing factor-like protein 1 [Rhodamnia argentea]XP_048138237.1 splicing factor-like protein 1 [Rhodamnia argentea]
MRNLKEGEGSRDASPPVSSEEDLLNEKKRSFDAADDLGVQSRKKHRSGENSKSDLESGSAASDCRCESGLSKASDGGSHFDKRDGSGSSGKRRWSSGGLQVGDEEESVEDDRNKKRRKTRWSSFDTRIKLLGPLQLPDFVKESVLKSDSDPEIVKLKAKLADLNSELQKPVLHDVRPVEKRSPSPEPVYNDLGIRVNTREVRLREELIRKRQGIILKLIQMHPTFKTPPSRKPSKLFKKLYVPVKQYPGYNFVGHVLGPSGNTQKRMEKETGARISLRGAGSFTRGKHASENDDLHVYIEADNQESLDTAAGMVEKLLIPVDEGMTNHKRAQLKEFSTLKNFYPKAKGPCFMCGMQRHPNHGHACPDQPPASTYVSCNTSSSNGNLYVSHLPLTVDDDRLKGLFCPYGKLVEAKLIRDHNTGVSKGYGFIRFENPADAAIASSQLNGFKMGKKILTVKVAGKTKLDESISPSVVSQTAWLGPPGSLLLEPQGSCAASITNHTTRPGPPESLLVEASICSTPCVANQVAWPGPPGSQLVEHQASFLESEAMSDLPSPNQDFKFTPSSLRSLSNSSNTSSLRSSSCFSDCFPSSSPCSLAQFPGHPDYPYSSSSFETVYENPKDFQTPDSLVKPINWPTAPRPS